MMRRCALDGCEEAFETTVHNRKYCCKTHKDRASSARYTRPADVAWEEVRDLKHFAKLSPAGKRKVLLGETDFSVVMFDIEATHLKANVGRILCCSFKPLDGEVYTFHALEKDFKKADVYDDGALAEAIRDELEGYDIIVGHNSKQFDLRYVNARALRAGGRVKEPQPHIDTYWVWKSKSAAWSGLDAVQQFLLPDSPEKKTKIAWEQWMRALGWDRKLREQAMAEIIDHCAVPEHRVLTADLQWKAGGDLKVGDALVGFTEHGSRKWEKSIVESVKFAREPVYRVVLSNGEELFVTAEHRWLVDNGNITKWVETQNLRGSSAGRYASKVTRFMPLWNTRNDYDAGYLAGMLDGEGTMGRGHTLSVAQRPGAVLDRTMDILLREMATDPGVRLVDSVNRGGLGRGDTKTVHIRSRLPERLKLLGSIRPARMLEKVDVDAFGRMERRSGERYAVESVEPAGSREIVKVQTTSRTFLLEGYGAHNCEKDVVVLENIYKVAAGAGMMKSLRKDGGIL